MSDNTSAKHSDPGWWIRAALVLFPAGTILLGIASFGIWQMKKNQEEDRSFKYAQALHRDITPASLDRHFSTLSGVLQQKDVFQAVPAYLQSVMGEENMGYTVRRQRFEATGQEASVTDAELAGKKFWREVNLVLVPYGPDDPASAMAAAVMLVVAHDLTGRSTLRTLRFAAMPRVEKSLHVIGEQLRGDGERILNLHVLGTLPVGLKEAWQTQARGSVVNEYASLPTTADAAAVFAQKLKQQLIEQSGEP